VVTFDVPALTSRLTELEEELAKPDFWNDQDRAAKLSAEHTRVQRKLQRYERLNGNVAFLDEGAGTFPEEELLPVLRETQDELAQLQEDALFSGEYDGGDSVVTIQADAGGTDAQDWAEILLRMYLRWAERRSFKTEILETSPGEEYGIKSATFTVRGENAYGILKAERGKHRLVRLSPFDSAHRRHTSFAQVIVAPLLEDAADIEIDDDEIRIDTFRSSGAGGQHVNKTDSAVRITHLPTNIVVSVQNERSQGANKETALKILRSRLAEKAEEEREAELARERGGVSMGFGGSAVRSYVLHPYQLVKDHRTDYEMGNIQAVLDGALDGFIHAYLLQAAGNSGESAKSVS
jgi:peptide chain release factor 2